MLPAAFFTDTVDLKGMSGGEIVIFTADFLFQLAHLLGKELDRTAAFGTNHVMMTAAIVLVLVTRNAIVKGDFAGQAAIGEQLECAINRSVADPSVFLLNQTVQFVGREVVPRLQKCPQDGVALSGLFEADALQVLMKDALGFAHHLPRENGLIVDALLQHGE